MYCNYRSMYIRTYIHTCMHAYIHTYIHIYIYMSYIFFIFVALINQVTSLGVFWSRPSA